LAKPERSFELKALIVLLLLGAWMGLARLQSALFDWALIEKLGAQPGALYLALTGGVWALLLLLSALGLFFGARRAPLFTILSVTALAALYWFDRLALTRSTDAQVNGPFAAVLTLLLLAYTILVLRLPRQKELFG
jgi:hypothetical protein